MTEFSQTVACLDHNAPVVAIVTDRSPELDRAALGFVLRQVMHRIPSALDELCDARPDAPMQVSHTSGITGHLQASPAEADWIITTTVTVRRREG